MIFLMGPTASGKSGLALHLASRFPLEIVNADSVQVYRGMDIGAAKPTPEERQKVPHHLLDLVAPDEHYSVGRYRRQAMAVVATCQEQKRTPVFVGGSGLYFRALEQGLAPVPEVPEAVVQHWRTRGEQEGWTSLHAHLQQVDPVLASRLSPADAQRIVRGLAVWESSGFPLTYWQQQPHSPVTAPVLKMAIAWPREDLYLRIEQRFDQMMQQGFLEEVTTLWHQKFDRTLPAMKAVGYRQLLRHLDGEISLATAVQLGKQESRRYAKRQLTWLRRENNLVWLSAGEEMLAMAEKLVRDYLNRVYTVTIQTPH